jgi:arylsulfatase A-like enzyme
VIRLPGAANEGRRVDSIVTLVDVAPTLLALAGVPDPGAPRQGRDLSALMAGETGGDAEGPIVVAIRDNKKKYFAPWKTGRGDLNIALREGALKAIVNVEIGTVELYDLETDPGETDDLAGRRPDEAARFAEFATTWLSRCSTGAEGATSDLDEATLDRLRALGYVD